MTLKEKIIPLFIGLSLVALLSFVLYWNPPLVQKTALFLDNSFYDLKLRYAYKPLESTSPVVIVDIDDKSLAAEGRWPWTRKKFAELVAKLHELNASVVASDIFFSEPEKNLVEEIITGLQKQGRSPPPELKRLEPFFDYDEMLAKTLEKKKNVLAFTLTRSGASHGFLPPAALPFPKGLSFPNYPHYLSNIALLQKAAQGGGAINATPDADGVIRFSPLLLRHNDGFYPSLSFQAVMLHLSENQPHLITHSYPEGLVLEGIRLGKLSIPVNPAGQILVPFRGPPYSFPYVSATDLLHGHVSSKQIANQVVFIGTSATGMGDLPPTAIAPIFPGVEIHASIAASILDQYFPYRPAWGRGVSLALILFLGTFCACCFPFLGSLANTLIFFFLSCGIFFWDLWIWKTKAISFSAITPIASIFLLYLFNEIFGYSIEAKKKKEIKSMFGQYISPQYLDTMLKKGKDFDLMGENKELTALFSDIRNFTSLSEKFTAPQLKEFLNKYFTPMTQVLFDHRGTIDKYVGDMIMAFWGAPLPDQEHARHAIDAALAMQRKLQELNLGIHIGIGVNTGMMNVGDMGSKFRRAYTVLGDAVNLASRLEGLTKKYGVKIFVGEETKKKVEEHFTFKKIDKVQVKGKEKAIEIYEPLCKVEEATESLRSEAVQHEQALEAYWKRDWDRASHLFEQLASHNPALYSVYQERIEAFRKSPPSESWNGVHILDTK